MVPTTSALTFRKPHSEGDRMKPTKIKPGNTVQVTDPLDLPQVGTVIDMLSSQMTVWIHSTDNDKGRLLFVPYNSDWRLIKKAYDDEQK